MDMRRQAEDVNTFLYWTVGLYNEDILDAVSDFSMCIYVLSRLNFGGQEYDFNQRRVHDTAYRLLVLIEDVDRYKPPLALRLLAIRRASDKYIHEIAMALSDVVYRFAGSGCLKFKNGTNPSEPMSKMG